MSLISNVYTRGRGEPASEAEKDEAARRLWRSGADLVAIRLSLIKCDIHRQAVINELTRQYGARAKKAE